MKSETSVFLFQIQSRTYLGENTPLANVNIREAITKAFNKEDLARCSISKWFCTS